MAANLWFIYAISASLFWGMGYVLSEKLLKDGLTPAFLMFIGTLVSLPIYFIITQMTQELRPGIDYLTANKTKFALLIMTALLTVGGNFFILMSISGKNATLASLIEITYPVFTFIFAWMILKDVQLTLGTAIGGLLILSGIAVVYLKG